MLTQKNGPILGKLKTKRKLTKGEYFSQHSRDAAIMAWHNTQ
jgi:hypothetical protein